MTENGISVIRFNELGLVPAVVQDEGTCEVLMVAYMNREALEKTLETGRAHFYSRSRRSLWLKGETSGNFLNVRAVLYDCDADTLLVHATPEGPACHTGRRSCFFRALKGEATPLRGPAVIERLFGILKARKGADAKSSYTASLYEKGLPAITEKIREESAELIEAAEEKGRSDVVHELTDLWFHTMVLLAHLDIEPEEVYAEFERRFGTSGIEEKRSRGEKS